MKHKIYFHPKAESELALIAHGNKKLAKQIIDNISNLEQDPFPSRFKKIAERIYRFRHRDTRIIYAYLEDRIIIYKIAKRDKNTYKDLSTIVKRLKRMVEEIEELQSSDKSKL